VGEGTTCDGTCITCTCAPFMGHAQLPLLQQA
jgi:hypothetical protein